MSSTFIPSIAIQYRQNNFDTQQNTDKQEQKQKRILGFQVAGESFLEGYVSYGKSDKLYCYTDNQNSFQTFSAQVETIQAQLSSPQKSLSTYIKKSLHFLSTGQFPQLAEAGCLYLSHPSLGDHAWHRRFINQRAYSICGVVHSSASQLAMDKIADLLIAPVQEWDALICPSVATQKMVLTLLEEYQNYLAARWKMADAPQKITANVQIPVLPYGIPAHHFTDGTHWHGDTVACQARKKWRERFSMAENDVVVLFLGRLNAYAKAHPTAMWLALEQASRALQQSATSATNPHQKPIRFHCILAGWFATPQEEQEYLDAAHVLAPSVAVHHVDGRIPEVRREIWHAADIFCSLSDNIQETFGLSPVEAMAHALPMVVADWDGYRDTVRHGLDGFCIATYTPSPTLGAGDILALRHTLGLDLYGPYVGQTALATAVDVDKTAQALIQLGQSVDLRRQMGLSARERAFTFHWSSLMPRYEELWQDLAQRRAFAATEAPRQTYTHAPTQTPAVTLADPRRADPFFLFASYPTGYLHDDTPLQIPAAQGDHAVHRLEKIIRLSVNTFGQKQQLSTEQQRLVLSKLVRWQREREISGQKSVTYGEIKAYLQVQPIPIQSIPTQDRVVPHQELFLARTVVWWLKMGIISYFS